MTDTELNPIIKCDYPDPDVIRVNDTFYMVSTTMYFMPGGAVLRSYDLKNWEIASYIFDTLDDTPEERLERELNSYGGGMWAPCIRYKDGVFHVLFVSHFTQTTYHFTATDVCGKWKKDTVKGYYHDCSLLFDDDGRNYLVYGNNEIHLVELDKDLKAPVEGSDRVIVKEPEGYKGLGYEGSHIYKINGKYYIFFIHWPQGKMRTEACFVSDSIDGEFKGKDVFSDDGGFFNMGVAQGGIVDSMNGKWYAILFRDSGAVGRMPMLVPVTWENDFPVFGINGKVVKRLDVASSKPYYRYEPLYTSDSFMPDPVTGESRLKLQWEWNHCPDNRLWYFKPEGGLVIKTDKICSNLTYAQNTLTQRMMFPRCEAEVTVDAKDLNEGDVAGLCALQSSYGLLGITKNSGCYYLIKVIRTVPDGPIRIGECGDFMPGEVVEKIRLKSSKVTFCLKPNFEGLQDKLDFFYLKDGEKWTKVGAAHRLFFKLDHFTGCRFGLFVYSTRQTGGKAVFTDFKYRYE